jgi:TorA maturation chaperone TorD
MRPLSNSPEQIKQFPLGKGVTPQASGVVASDALNQVQDDVSAAYQVVLGFCAQALKEDPSPQWLAALAEQAPLLREPPFSDLAPEASTRLADYLQLPSSPDTAPSSPDSFGGSISARQPDYPDKPGNDGLDDLIQAIRGDYTYLFLMVGESGCSPYESVYRTEDATLFGPTTAQVKQEYARFGYSLASGLNEPADHIGLELAFVAALLQDGGPEALAALPIFMEEHLMRFAPTFCAKLKATARTPFYQAIAELTLEVITSISK